MSQDNSYSDHPALEFLDEEPTVPGTPIARVQSELDRAASVVDGFTARLLASGYGRSETAFHWTQRLSEELDAKPEARS